MTTARSSDFNTCQSALRRIDHRSPNLLQLLQMVQIVSGQLLGDPQRRQVAILGMLEGALALSRRQSPEQCDIETSKRRVRIERRRAVGMVVSGQPRILIDWLRDITLLAERKTHAS